MSVRSRILRKFAIALLFAIPALLVADSASGQNRPTRSQAAAVVALYKAVRQQCAAEGPACEEKAKRQFVEVMNCVVHGRPAVDPATVDQQFTQHVDLVSAVVGSQEAGAAGDPGPCFAAASTPAEAPAAGEAPTIESLRRFRKEMEGQSRPVAPTTEPDAPSAQERLKADVEALKAKARAGTIPGAARVAPGPAPGFGTPAPATVPPVPGTAPTAPTAPPTGVAPLPSGPEPIPEEAVVRAEWEALNAAAKQKYAQCCTTSVGGQGCQSLEDQKFCLRAAKGEIIPLPHVPRVTVPCYTVDAQGRQQLIWRDPPPKGQQDPFYDAWYKNCYPLWQALGIPKKTP